MGAGSKNKFAMTGIRSCGIEKSIIRRGPDRTRTSITVALLSGWGFRFVFPSMPSSLCGVGYSLADQHLGIVSPPGPPKAIAALFYATAMSWEVSVCKESTKDDLG
jgi:hypothetical protein